MTPFFRLPTRVTIAPGCIEQVADEVASFACQRVLLVVDQGLQATRWPDAVTSRLQQAGIKVHVEDCVEQNPRYTTVDQIADRARNLDIHLVIGLGGGSVIDAAKAVAMLLENSGSCLQYEGKNLFQGSAPFIAIPTTCGTGSEVTWVAVITHEAQQRKLSIKGDAMFPDVALVDPDLLETLPAKLIACTGMDALTHALEAYTVNCGNPVSDAFAEKAIHLLFTYLPRLVSDASDHAARFEVMRASTLAGMAFGNADVGAVHCLSETIGGMWDVPHGLANAMLLMPVMLFHEPVIRERLATLYGLLEAKEAGNKSVALQSQAMLSKINALTAAVQIPSFESLKIPENEFPGIAKGAVTNNSNSSNPQKMDEHAYLKILRGLNNLEAQYLNA